MKQKQKKKNHILKPWNQKIHLKNDLTEWQKNNYCSYWAIKELQ